MTTSTVGAFRSTALQYSKLGLTVIPCGGEGGKRPLVKWSMLKRPLGPNALDKWQNKFPDSNLDIVTGPSNLCVVDVDDSDMVDTMQEKFGATPLIARTPRGGIHLYYRQNGERSQNAFQPGVDVKAIGGFVVAPP